MSTGMPTFLDRYRDGAREEVWSELERLGSAVREEPYSADARAVAEETMKRVRHNAELLVERLETLGYQFLSGGDPVADQFQLIRGSLDFADRYSAEFERSWSPPNPQFPEFEAVLDHLRTQTQALREQGPALREMLGAMEEMVAKERAQDPPKRNRAISPPSSTVSEDIARYEESIGGPIPLSVKAWSEIVGSVSLVGAHPTLCFRTPGRGPSFFVNPDFTPDAEQRAAALRAAGVNATTTFQKNFESPLADPLEIRCDFEGDYDMDEEVNRRMVLGTNDRFKAGTHGGDFYSIEVPNAGADAAFGDWHGTSFVGYLRIAFQWGGFPGWERYAERPEKELGYLQEGLLPF